MVWRYGQQRQLLQRRLLLHYNMLVLPCHAPAPEAEPAGQDQSISATVREMATCRMATWFVALWESLRMSRQSTSTAGDLFLVPPGMLHV